jgi:protein TonB
MDRAAHGLVRHAARRAPGPLAERLEEEWLADLAARREGLSRLRLALGCCWAGYVITRETGLAVPVAGAQLARAQLARANLGGYWRDDSLRFSRSTLTFLLVVSLHVAIVCGLAAGLGSKLIKHTPAPFTATMIEKPLPPIDLPVPPTPQMERPTLWVPPMEKGLPFEKEAEQVVPTGDTLPVPTRPESAPVVAARVSRVQGGPGAGFPSASDFYPPAAIRAGEEGVATVQACVDGRGRLLSAPTIVQSSGSARLDEGALKLAGAGSGHYRASTEDGRPVNACYPFRIRFDFRK